MVYIILKGLHLDSHIAHNKIMLDIATLYNHNSNTVWPSYIDVCMHAQMRMSEI